MNLLLDPRFWIAAIGLHVCMHVCPARHRSRMFGLFNLLVITALIGWRAAAMVALLAFVLWLPLRLVPRMRRGRSDAAWIACGALCGLLVLVFVGYKLGREHNDIRLAMAGTSAWLRLDGLGVLAALSFSYVFLRAIDLVLAVTTGTAELADPVSVAGYLAPFHMLPAGPIASFSEHVAMNSAGAFEPSLTDLVLGLNQISTGLFYKFVIAESLRMFAFGLHAPLAAPESLADTMFLLIYVFFDFAGYSRVALGVGRLCGIPTPQNFKAPLLAPSITAFWTRWHMSLGSFVSRNIYTPLQLGLVRRLGLARAHWASLATLLLSFAFVGVWHRMSTGFLLWGLGMGAIMFLEKLVRDYSIRRRLFQQPRAATVMRVLGPAYVFIVISLSLRFVMREFLGV